MGDITGEIIAGLIVAAVVGISGIYLKRYFDPDEGILPGHYKRKEKIDYSRLSGKWHLYYITQYPYLHPTPIWLHGIQELKIKGRYIDGATTIPDHPETNISYRLHGEIRGGKMIIADYCVQDETEFATMIYPDLMKPNLVGIWTGLDGYNHLVAAPTILSRNEKSPKELNQILHQSIFHLLVADNPIYFMFIDGEVVDPNAVKEANYKNETKLN